MRERILAETIRLFVQRGYHGVSMREIAQACGVTKAALYYHFADKSDLLWAILNRHLQEVAEIVAGCDMAQPINVRSQIERLIDGLLHLPFEQRALVRLGTQEVANLDVEKRQAFVALYEEKFIGRIVQIFQEGVQSGELRAVDARVATWTLLGMLYPFFSPSAVLRSREAEAQMAAQMLTIFFDGVRNEL